jgi:hypothetical protein
LDLSEVLQFKCYFSSSRTGAWELNNPVER